MEVTTRKITKSEAKMTLMQQEEKKIMTLENIISWIFSIMQAKYLLVLICTTKTCLKKQFQEEISQREQI